MLLISYQYIAPTGHWCSLDMLLIPYRYTASMGYCVIFQFQKSGLNNSTKDLTGACLSR